MRARLAQLGELDQAKDDAVVGTLRPSLTALPKGLSGATLHLGARALREERRYLSAVEVARLTGPSRVTARRYLDHLVRSGNVELTLRYEAAGRPEHRYRCLAPEVTTAGR